jgi:hypothetical protein
MALTALTVYVAFQHLGWLNFPVGDLDRVPEGVARSCCSSCT